MSEFKELTTVNADKPAQELHELPVATPAVDIFENAEGYLLRADLPGVQREQVDLQYERGELRIHARREWDTSIGSEREFGGVLFRRAFKFPEAIDSEHIHAELTDGVLQLRLPKSPESRPRKIEVRVA